MESTCDYCGATFEDTGACIRHMIEEHAPEGLARAVAGAAVATTLQEAVPDAFGALDLDPPDICIVMFLDMNPDTPDHVTLGGTFKPDEATDEQRQAIAVQALTALNAALEPYGIQMRSFGELRPGGQG